MDETGKTALSGPRPSPTQSHNAGERGSATQSTYSPQLPEREAEFHWPEEVSVLAAGERGGLGGQGTGEGGYSRKVTSDNCKHMP